MHQVKVGHDTRRNVPCGPRSWGVVCTVHGPGVVADADTAPNDPVRTTATTTANEGRRQPAAPIAGNASNRLPAEPCPEAE
jgi:hypothetical protein